MVDTLLKHQKNAERGNNILETLKLKAKDFAVTTLHRPSNVDKKEILQRILESFETLAQELPIVFPIHPRTEKK